jgi:hypothetical protein
MGWETYSAIALCYSVGCFLSYRIGAVSGFDRGVRRMMDFMSERTGKSLKQIASDLLGEKL